MMSCWRGVVEVHLFHNAGWLIHFRGKDSKSLVASGCRLQKWIDSRSADYHKNYRCLFHAEYGKVGPISDQNPPSAWRETCVGWFGDICTLHS